MATVDSFEPSYFGIKKKAVQSLVKLSEAQEEYKVWNCKDNPYYYTDYDGYGFEDEEGRGNHRALSIDETEALCAGCPLLKLCYDFAVANEEEHGIWGGVDFGAIQDEDKLF